MPSWLLYLLIFIDDVELGCGGTILRHISLGFKVGLIDLTRGELGTRGSADIRDKEAKVASSTGYFNINIPNMWGGDKKSNK